MTEIWRKDDGKWSTIGPSGFVNEAELHDQIVEAPELLPLSGQPFLAAAFSEVGLGGGSADVLAFEDSGRPVVIEVKLEKNPEAKRDVIAQTLAYAASLYGISVEKLEGTILAKHLRDKEYKYLADAVEEATDASDFNRDGFYRKLAAHLDKGSFRLVIVLDDVRKELIRLAGYLDAITTDAVDVDIVTVSSYVINDDQILIPQRIDPDRENEDETDSRATDPRPVRRGGTTRTEGAERFLEINADRDAQTAAHGRELVEWVKALEAEGLCRPYSVEGDDGGASLRLHMLDERKSFAHFWPESNGIGAWLFPTVIERRAPAMLATIRDLSGVHGNKGGARATPELLAAFAEAYREALTTEPHTEFTEDSGLFRESLADLSEERRQRLTELADWADSLKQEGLCRVESFRGKSGRFTLLMRLPGKKAGFSVIWNDVDASGWEGMMTLNRSVITRHAPGTLPRIEAIAGRVGQGTNAEPTPELLDALADAYREAAGR